MQSPPAHDTIIQVLCAYDLAQPLHLVAPAQQGVNNLGVLVHTPQETLRCKVYTAAHPPEALCYEHDLLRALAARGCSFALPVPRATRDGATLQQCALGWLALLPNLPGATLDPADLAQTTALGSALGELHAALAALPPRPRPGRALFSSFFDFPPPARDPRALQPTMVGAPDTAAARELFAWWRHAAQQMAAFVGGAYQGLPAQLCHNDMSPANVLVQHGQVSAVLDFEFAGLAPRALDLAMALRMTMRVWERPDPWAAARALCQGYRRWACLSAHECAQLTALIRLRSMMSILWALGRAAPIEAGRLIAHLTYLRAACAWLDAHGERLTALVAAELA